MNRLVYLFELDPAKTSRKDAENAEFAIFHEIIKNGNKVVMSVNQFVESRVMISAVYDEESYKHVRRLFEEGAIKISLFADVCSISQYVQDAVEKCLSKNREGYVFSTLPVKANDNEMLREVRNSLKYSDLTNINAILDAEYQNLRDESNPEKRAEILEKIRKLKITIRFLSLVLKLSVTSKSSNPAKPEEGRSFIDFLGEAKSILRSESFRRRDINTFKGRVVDRLTDAMDHFIDEGLSAKKINRRSTWLNYLTAKNRTDTVNEFAIEVVNLCYNYAVQDTVYGVTKQYDEKNFKATFKYDFIKRINRFWGIRTRTLSSVSYVEDAEYRLFYPKQWKRAAAIAAYNSDHQTVSTFSSDDNPIERKHWYALLMKKFGITLGYTAAYVAVFCLVGFLIDLLNGVLGMPTIGLVFSNLGSIVLVVVASVVLSIFTKLPNVLECAMGVVHHINNLISAMTKKYDLYAKK